MPPEQTRRRKTTDTNRNHMPMGDDQIDHWQKTIRNAEEIRAEDHVLWRRLINAYRLELEVDVNDPRKISRFFPLTRQMVASLAINYPHIFMSIQSNDMQYAVEKLQRFSQALIETIEAKKHIHQQIFDALYCCIGWLKSGVNPPGDEDIIPPYVANDSMQNGLFYVTRVSPFKVFPDPLTPPHDIGQAQFIIEKMAVPTDYVKSDPRFINTGDLKPLAESEEVEQLVGDEIAGAEDPEMEGERKGLFESAKRLRGITILYQVHDRMNKRQITFARGVRGPIQNIQHPLLAGRVETRPDPIDPNRQLVVPNTFQPTGGWLVKNGTPFIPLKFDLSSDHLYGLPMMAYAEDTQKGVVESVTRRHQWLKRLTYILLGRKSEQEENSDLADRVKTGSDFEIAWVDDVNNSFRGMPQDNIPPDQLGIESDYRAYEDQILQTSQLINSGQKTLTATQSALAASFGQLNREWLQEGPKNVYADIVHNGVRISGDLRYTPRNFLVNVSENEHDPVYEVITADLLKAPFKVRVEAGSMRPLFEEMEKEDGLALFQYLIQIPEIPRIESIKHLLRTFRVPNIERFIGGAESKPEIRAAQIENQWIVMRGEDPGVLPEQDHETHLEIHGQIMEDPLVKQQLTANPAIVQAIREAVESHFRAHQEILAQKAKGTAPQAGAGISANINGFGQGGSPAGAVNDTVNTTIDAVRSGAQKISQGGAALARNQN